MTSSSVKQSRKLAHTDNAITNRLTSVSVVIPLYNEEQSLVNVVRNLVADLECIDVTFEVILAENGSTDSTAKVADALAEEDQRIRAIHLPLPDYGRAMCRGFLAGSKDYLINFSVDLVDLEFLQAALSRLADGDIVLGSKYLARGYDQRPLTRRLGGFLLSSFVRIVFRLSVSDTHGLLVLRRNKVVPLLRQCHFGHEVFDTELVVRARRVGLTIIELPLHVTEERPSRIGSLRRALRILRELVELRLALGQE